MAKLRLYPPFGTIKDAKSLKFEIQGLTEGDTRINMEDATHGRRVSITSLQNMGNNSYAGVMELDIPKDSSQLAISIFAHIEEKQSDGLYKTAQICPAVFSIEEVAEKSSGDIFLSPSFIGPEDLCKASVKISPNSRVSISIGSSMFRVISDGDGMGSIHFKGSDILKSSDADSVQKLPVYLYSEEDGYTNKKFSGAYLNILPHSLAVHATLDPRCDTIPSGGWVMPPECIETTDPPIIEPPGPVIPPIDIPTSCTEVEFSQESCRIFSSSVTLLNNGMVLYAYASPDTSYSDTSDDRYNINRVFIDSNNTSVDVQIIGREDVVIEPKEPSEDFRIHVSETLWSSLPLDNPSEEDVYVVLFSGALGFQKIKVLDRLIDEYTDANILIGDASGTDITINGWLFCVNSVFYHASQLPSVYIGSNALPYIQDSNDNYLSVINVSVACNANYIGDSEESYVYIIAEALIDDKSQLFFYGLSLGKDDSFESQSYGWKQLTYTGNNKLPKAKVDSVNNLHVIWESDRGDINQLYYGVIGLSYISVASSVLSASIDKYADVTSKEITSFDYLDAARIEAAEAGEYSSIPVYDSQNLLSVNNWSVESGNGGAVSVITSSNYLDNLTITANAVWQNAMANMPLQIVLDGDGILETNPSADASTMWPYSQYNYQISFTMSATIVQNGTIATGTIYNGVVVEEKEIDKLVDNWVDNSFESTIDSGVANQPVYVKGRNKFTIGRRDNVFDRIVPVLGSYKNANPSETEFQIKILKNDNNLKDFTIGLMFEKTYVAVTNIENPQEYASRCYSIDGYIPSWTETVYTGRAKFVAFIKTEDVSDDRADYVIVREFPEVIDVNEITDYSIILNYTSISSDEVSNILNTYGQSYSDKFIGTITMLIDGVAKFSQSFISTINYDYNYFDIGFGIPYGGYYVSDKMTPSKLGIFDNVETVLQFTDISVTSPTFEYNTDIITVPPTVRSITDLKVEEEEDIEAPILSTEWIPPASESNELLTLGFRDNEKIEYSLYADQSYGEPYSTVMSTYGIGIISIEFNPGSNTDRMTIESDNEVLLYDTGYVSSSTVIKFNVDVADYNAVNIYVGTGAAGSTWNFTAYFKRTYSNNSFIQVPITVEGINQSADIDIGLCNEVHVAWQSNRDRHWNIFYSNSIDRLSPFRFETALTDTDSNSLKPSMAISRTGARMVTWHDNRRGNYNVYMARSIGGFECDKNTCEMKMLKFHESEIIECSVVLEFTAAAAGIYNFSLEFYLDSGLSNLYKTISIEDAVNRWFVDGVAIGNSLVYEDDVILGITLTSGETVTLSFIPAKGDDIFDKVLYVKLINSVE